MKNIKLLDCTLRDGGYTNDWKFGHNNAVSIFERLVDSEVDIIEIGFLDDRRPFDIDRTIMPDTASVSKIFGALERKNSLVVGMIDYGTCDIKNVQPCEESFLDGIRVIFKKHLMHEAMEFCRQIKALGYKVCSQLVSVTSYSDAELMELISLVNDVKPYAVSMVDTYGLLYPEDMLHYFDILDEYVDDEVKIGFHAHNNFQLGYANALAFIEKDSRHDLIVDGTLYGMGKSAGNDPIELVAMRLNEKYGGNYKVDAMLEAIEESIMSYYAKTPWGYTEFYYLCAKNRCHPNYLTFFQNKKNLSTTKTDKLLSRIKPENKKLLYDKNIAEAIYQEYIREELQKDTENIELLNELKDRKVLLLGPGKNIQLQSDKVKDFIIKNDPYIVSINYLPDTVVPDCLFITNKRRYNALAEKLVSYNEKLKFLATSNVEPRNGRFDYIVERALLIDEDESIEDNSFIMLLRYLTSLKVMNIYCAGFDGYSEKEDNYYNPIMEYSFVKNEAKHLNSYVKRKLKEYRNNSSITFITYSAYDTEENILSASV